MNVELREEVAHIFARAALGSRCPWLGESGDVPLADEDLAAADAAIAICMKRAAEVASEFTPGGEHYERDDDTCSMPARIATALHALSRSPA